MSVLVELDLLTKMEFCQVTYDPARYGNRWWSATVRLDNGHGGAAIGRTMQEAIAEAWRLASAPSPAPETPHDT